MFFNNKQKIAFTKEIKKWGKYVCDLVKVCDMDNLFTSPAESNYFLIGVFHSFTRTIRSIVEKHELKTKVLSLPYEGSYALFPMLYNVEK